MLNLKVGYLLDTVTIQGQEIVEASKTFKQKRFK